MHDNIERISVDTLTKLVTQQKRGRFKGVVKDMQNTPSIDAFCTGRGACAFFFDYCPNKQTVIPKAKLTKSYILLHFGLSGSNELYDIDNQTLHRFDPGYCAIGILCADAHFEVRFEGKQHCQYVRVYLDLNCFGELIEEIEMPEKNPLQRNDRPFSSHRVLPIDSKQFFLLRELFFNSTYQDTIGDLYRESRLLELLHLTVGKLHDITDTQNTNLNRLDITALQLAKDILLQDITNPPSLKKLANLAGINEFKLKKGFKRLFGQTVYGMLHEERLIKARHLIEKDRMGVHKAAKQIGYKNASHFSRIFKQRFGVLPKQLKKNTAALFEDHHNE